MPQQALRRQSVRRINDRALKRFSQRFDVLSVNSAPLHLARAAVASGLLQALYTIRSDRQLMEHLDQRKLVEQCFGWLKTAGGLRNLHHRGGKRVQWVFHIVTIRGNSYRMRQHTELWQALHTPDPEPASTRRRRPRQEVAMT